MDFTVVAKVLLLADIHGSRRLYTGSQTLVCSSRTEADFEINVRIAVSLGIIGGGGLGQVLSVQQGLFAFTNMMATILVILVLIISVEVVS